MIRWNWKMLVVWNGDMPDAICASCGFALRPGEVVVVAEGELIEHRSCHDQGVDDA